MRVPVTNSQTIISSSSPNSKLNSSASAGNISTTFQTPTNNIPNLCYEPTSVLDLRRSPSPVAGDKPVSTTDTAAAVIVSSSVSEDHRQNNPAAIDTWDEHALQNLDWDSIMGDLGLQDDSNSALNKNNNNANNSCHPDDQVTPPFTGSEFDHVQLVNPEFYLSDPYSNQNNNLANNINFNSFDLSTQNGGNNNGIDSSNSSTVGLEFIEDIIRAANCFDSNELQLAHVILERLNQRLQSSTGKPLQRAAFFFKEALQSLLSGSNRTKQLSSWPDIVQTITAYRAFSAISPIPMFSHFTTNQALLEALNGSSFIHIVDFEIGFGGQYASLMKEISEKAESRKIVPPVLRITAVVPEEFVVESRLIRENLCQFAQDLKLRFHIDLISLRTFETLSFKSVKFMEGEKTAVLLTPAIFHRLGSINNISSFLTDVRRLSPSVVIFIDGEGLTDTGTASFKKNLVDSLEFYSMMLESLDAAVGGHNWVKRIETFVLRPKILAAVEGAGRMAAPPWREVFHGAGMRPVGLSQFADFQAECLLGKVQVRGFRVGKRHAELVLCWHDRPLVATSAWRC